MATLIVPPARATDQVTANLGVCRSNHICCIPVEVCGSASPSTNSGDDTQKATHVPIPNTTVKLLGPMIVPTSAKVGYCRKHFKNPRRLRLAGVFSLRDGLAVAWKCVVSGGSFSRSIPGDVVRRGGVRSGTRPPSSVSGSGRKEIRFGRLRRTCLGRIGESAGIDHPTIGVGCVLTLRGLRSPARWISVTDR